MEHVGKKMTYLVFKLEKKKKSDLLDRQLNLICKKHQRFCPPHSKILVKTSKFSQVGKDKINSQHHSHFFVTITNKPKVDLRKHFRYKQHQKE